MSGSPKVPFLELVLSGTWMRVPVGDRAREQAVLDVVRSSEGGEDRAAELRRLLDVLARTGGDQLLLRQDQPTLLTTAWPPVMPPPGLLAGGAAAIEALQQVAGARGVQVTGPNGYPVIRVDAAAPAPPGATYWIAHPGSGRILVMAVTDYVEGHGSDWLYDLVAGGLTWEDTGERGQLPTQP